MPDFILEYHGGTQPASPEEGLQQKAAWDKWAADLGDQMVNTGTPLGKKKSVSASGVADGPGQDPMIGFSVVRAESMDEAVAVARSCPFCDMGGTIEVAEMMKMP